MPDAKGSLVDGILHKGVPTSGRGHRITRSCAPHRGYSDIVRMNLKDARQPRAAAWTQPVR